MFSCCLISLLLMVVPKECTGITPKPCKETPTEVYGVRRQDVLLPCLTKDHDLAPLTFTLLKLTENNETEELLYPTDNLTIQEPRWSLQRNSSSVSFRLHKANFSDSGRYTCVVQRNQHCLEVSRVFLKIRECATLERVEALLNSVVTLTCPVPAPRTGTTQVTWEIVQGDQLLSVRRCPSSCASGGNNRTNPRPLCERVRTVQDSATGTESLIIRPVERADAAWYRCKAMQYCADVKITMKVERSFQLMTNECKHSSPFRATVNSTVTISCPALTTHAGAEQVTWGTIQGDQTFPTTHCHSHCPSSSAQRPLCERARTLKNGSLTIRPVGLADTQWYWCVVNASSCSQFKLVITETHFTTESETIVYSLFSKEPPESSREDTADVSSNVTVTVTASIISVFVLMGLLLAVGFSLRKKKKGVCKKLENQYAAYEEIIEKGNDTFYALVHNQHAEMGTFKGE